MNELGTLKKEGDLPADYDPNTGYYEIEEGNKFYHVIEHTSYQKN